MLRVDVLRVVLFASRFSVSRLFRKLCFAFVGCCARFVCRIRVILVCGCRFNIFESTRAFLAGLACTCCVSCMCLVRSFFLAGGGRGLRCFCSILHRLKVVLAYEIDRFTFLCL